MGWDTVSTFLPLKHSCKYCKNKQTKNPKQTNRQGFATANSITSVLFTSPTEYFYRDFSESLSHHFWHQLQCRSLSVYDCVRQINWVDPEGQSKEYFWITCPAILPTEQRQLFWKTSQTPLPICFWSELLKKKNSLRDSFSLFLSSFWRDTVMVNDTSMNLKAKTYSYHRCSVISIHTVQKYSQPVAKNYHYVLLACQHHTATSP